MLSIDIVKEPFKCKMCNSTKVLEILKGAYDARNMVIVDDSKEKHVCNDKGNYVITKGYNCDDVNDTYLLDRSWSFFLHLNSVSNVRSIVEI
jgi:hypothetical protein